MRQTNMKETQQGPVKMRVNERLTFKWIFIFKRDHWAFKLKFQNVLMKDHTNLSDDVIFLGTNT